jgi:vacuolar-type H+-ATPase subunit E/Vma4
MTRERRGSARPEAEGDRALLIESLWRDARREADETLARARTEASRIRADAETRAKAAIEDARARASRTASPEAARIVNRSRRASAGEALGRRQKVVEGLFAEVGSIVLAGAVPEADLAAAALALCAEVADSLPPGARGTLTARPADHERCRALLEARGLAVEVRGDEALAGGVLFTSAGGAETLDNTLPARLASLRSSPPLALYRELFPQPSPLSGKRA